jgi:uncharacterized membrane protein
VHCFAPNSPLYVDRELIDSQTLRWSPERGLELLPLAPDGAYMLFPQSVNNAGTMVGASTMDPSFAIESNRAVIVRKGDVTPLADPGGIGMGYYAINDRGQILGYWGAWLFYYGAQTSFLLDKGVYTEIHYPGAGMTTAYALNNKGQIAGFFSWPDDPNTTHGFILERGKYTRIDFPDAYNTVVLGINDRGQVVGSYNDWSFGFVATPKR